MWLKSEIADAQKATFGWLNSAVDTKVITPARMSCLPVRPGSDKTA
jgi:hypothetical protein